MNSEAPVFQKSPKLMRGALIATALGVILLVIGAFLDPTRLFYSYLAAFAFTLSLALGALIFLMIGHAMRAGWPVLVRRLNEAIVSVLPLLLLLFVPILVGARILYPWLRPETVADERTRELIARKTAFLNLPFFLVRAGIYFIIWLVFSELLRHFARKNDKDPSFDAHHKSYALSGGALPAVALSLSFASFDWLMGLEPGWYSSMFPVYYFAGGFVGALALLTIIAFGSERAGLLPGINTSHYYALGRLQLAFTIFWAYCAFFQILLIWSANKPDETTFYLARIRGPFLAETIFLAFGQFFIPFFVLLNYRLKRRPERLSIIAGFIVLVHYVDVHWLVVPSLSTARLPFHFLDLGALLAVGGVSVAFAAYRLRGERLLPLNDPKLREALEYESI